MTNKNDLSAPVKRYDIRQSHSFLLSKPFLAIFLSVFSIFVAFCIHKDLLGHSAWNTHWEARNRIGAVLFSGISITFLGYSIFGFLRRMKK